MFGLWLGFMGLAGAMALLFWMVLHFSVKNKYQEQTENDLQMAAQSIWDMYGDADFEANIALLAKSNDYFVQIVSENSMQVVFSVNNQGEKTAPPSGTHAPDPPHNTDKYHRNHSTVQTSFHLQYQPVAVLSSLPDY